MIDGFVAYIKRYVSDASERDIMYAQMESASLKRKIHCVKRRPDDITKKISVTDEINHHSPNVRVPSSRFRTFRPPRMFIARFFKPKVRL